MIVVAIPVTVGAETTVTTLLAEPPILLEASVTSDGNVGLLFSKAMSMTGVKESFHIISEDGSTRTITNTTLHSARYGTHNFIQLYLDSDIKGGDHAIISYTPGTVASEDGGLLAAIADMSIINNAPHPTLDTTELPVAFKDIAYCYSLTASNGTSPYTFDVYEGSLPMGLSLASNTGEISGTPETGGSFFFKIRVKDVDGAFDIKEYEMKISSPVCKINDTSYFTLDEALTTIPSSGSAVIELLDNIIHNEGVIIDRKTITFELNGYTININNPTNASGQAGLYVVNGGCVYLNGTGVFNVEGYSYGIYVASNGTLSRATVTNATARGGSGTAAYAYSKANLIINGNAVATGYSSFGTHAISGGIIEVYGNVDAKHQGICSSSSTIRVHGNVQAMGIDSVGNLEGIGVNVYDGIAEVGGNVIANRIGAMARAGGSITIDGTVTAPGYLQFNDYEFTTMEDYISPTTKNGYYTYQGGDNTIWIKEPAFYTLNVENGSGDGNYTANTQVNITADTAPSGKVFDHWETSNGGIFTDAASASTTFTMPATVTTVTAVYRTLEPPKPTYYTITVTAVSGGSISPSGNIQVPENSNQEFVITSDSGYVISDVKVDEISMGVISTYTFSNVTKNHSLSATFSMTGGSTDGETTGGNTGGTTGDSGSSENSNTPANEPVIDQEKVVYQPVFAGFELTSKMNKKGHATVTIPQSKVINAIGKATQDAKKQKKTENGIGVEIKIKTSNKARSVTLVLTKSVLRQLTDSKVQQFNLDTGNISITLNLDALKDLQNQSKGNVSILLTPVKKLQTSAKAVIGTRPIYKIEFKYVKNGVTKSITSLRNGSMKIGLAYIPVKQEVIGSLFAFEVNNKGKALRINNSIYDENSKQIIFNSNYFSVYGVGFISSNQKFTDISSHWAKKSIDYMVARGLFTGISQTEFSPESPITRGLLAAVLGKLSAVDISSYKNSSFNDVNAENSFLPYIEWAYQNGIIGGIGDKQFAPDQAVTREELASILLKYAKATGYNLPVTHKVMTFSDSASIAENFKEAVTTMQQAGAIMGKKNNLFHPKAEVTRAEAAAILYRYIKIGIDPSTAYGWVQNDDGQWSYFYFD